MHRRVASWHGGPSAAHKCWSRVAALATMAGVQRRPSVDGSCQGEGGHLYALSRGSSIISRSSTPSVQYLIWVVPCTRARLGSGCAAQLQGSLSVRPSTGSGAGQPDQGARACRRPQSGWRSRPGRPGGSPSPRNSALPLSWRPHAWAGCRRSSCRLQPRQCACQCPRLSCAPAPAASAPGSARAHACGPARLRKVLWDLRCLARARLAHYDQGGVVLHRVQDLSPASGAA